MLTELSDSLLDLICEYLSYNDLFNLRSTCKKLKLFIDQKKFKSLNLFFQKDPWFYDLFYTNESIFYVNSLRIDDFQIFYSPKFKNSFDKIQKLIICQEDGYKSFDIRLDELNHFTQLIHLEIIQAKEVEGKLNLNNLEICFINSHEISSFEIDCPNLIAYKTTFWAQPKFIGDTKKLTYFFIHTYLAIFWYNSKRQDYLLYLYSILKNVSKICFCDIVLLLHFLTDINRNELKFNCLEQIEIEDFCFFRNYIHIIDRIISNLSLMNRSRKKEIKFLISNHPVSLKELTTISKLISHYYYGHYSFLKRISNSFHISLKILKKNWFYLGAYPIQIDDEFFEILKKNSPLLDCFLPAIMSIDLEKQIELDEKMLKKMKRLRIINTSPIIFIRLNSGKFILDKNNFNLILRTGYRLEILLLGQLDFEYSALSELPKYCPHLKWLCLTGNFKSNDLYFISKLKYLEDLQITKFKPEREFFTFIFENCSNLMSLSICGYSQDLIPEIRITYKRKLSLKTGKKKYKFGKIDMIGKNDTIEFETSNSLLDYCYSNNIFDFTEIEEDTFLQTLKLKIKKKLEPVLVFPIKNISKKMKNF